MSYRCARPEGTRVPVMNALPLRAPKGHPSAILLNVVTTQPLPNVRLSMGNQVIQV